MFLSLPPVPTVTPTIAAPITRLLDVPPYNTFTASCTATVEVPGLEGRVQLRTQFQWKMKKDGQSFGLIKEIPYTQDRTVRFERNMTDPGRFIYRCRCDLEGTGINSKTDVQVSVIGKC